MSKERLRKATLKVTGYAIDKGSEQFKKLKTNKERRYPLKKAVDLTIYTNQGNLKIKTKAGFTFDGRSGPAIVDWYVPNLGTLDEIICWFAHDCNGYGQDLSFKDTNVLLYAMLRDLPKYKNTKCTLIQLAVSLSDSWYGDPKEDDWCYANRDLVKTEWVTK